MERLRRASALFFFVALVFCLHQNLAQAQTIREPDDTTRIVSLENVSVEDGTVTGEIRNRSPHTLRDVQILVRYTWLWKNEFKPGKDDPGASFYHTIPGEVPPGGTARFKFAPSPPLPRRPDGSFQTAVSIAGFSEVIPQTR